MADSEEYLHELEQVREQLEAAQRLARLGSWYANRQTGELSWSPTIFEIFGFDPATFEPSRDAFFAAVHPDDRDAVQRSVEASRASGRYDVVHRIVRPDGSVRVVHERSRAEVDADGRLTRLVGTVQDVTELRETQETLQRVLRATNDGWWDEDVVAGTAYYSPRWWAIHGYEPPDGPASIDTWKRFTHPDDLEPARAAFRRAVEAREVTFTVHRRSLHRDGHVVPTVVRGFVEYGPDGAPVRVSGATTDLTEVRRAEQAQEAFVSNVSHELRTPLTSIGGALELLAAGRVGQLPAGAEQLVTVAVRNTTRLRALIDDLLDAEQLAGGRARFDLADRSLRDIVAQAVADTQPYADGHEVRLVVAPSAGDATVRCDGTRIGQVVANLLSNAVKYAPRGSEVTVDVVRVARGEGEPWSRVEVRDTGRGVPESFRDRAFQRFAQADPSDPVSRGGTGLGLAISREIVEQHGGEVGYVSEPGDTRFWFELPVAGAPDAAATLA